MRYRLYAFTINMNFLANFVFKILNHPRYSAFLGNRNVFYSDIKVLVLNHSKSTNQVWI